TSFPPSFPRAALDQTAGLRLLAPRSLLCHDLHARWRALIWNGESEARPSECAGSGRASCWLEIPEHFADVTLDAFIVMPDHLHGIVIISGMLYRHSVGAQHAAPLRSIGRLPAPTGSEGCSHGSLGAIVRSFKSATTKRINEMRHTPEKRVWQRNYHDRIIRDDREMQRARHYVLLNPLRWKDAW